ncbi:bacteriocin immunity protein [Lactiplantibacillus mudanjiangensis]|uniref:Bacteriocin immunity protein [Lactobacillus plantarum JDM1] n=1 Tax=Lactiplantibacillus mudanjiangensis TaxID=1296538 RepID=A0A660DX15_9LACO|nr:bacteriocin immunity protein [Lactiplantibacillus mudanjiangensis]VDG25297.1 bacteriocin immunity protein [Lactobacillus plantarum JDM1] [Lactiplantibacillus mudanjiangensis]VDG27677.1 bacteriocin immunity protein [Lactobacillus plantarum JDM1] [Lactiplantibacillus mudanjiangensis]VDG33025.1 bacteriocin immunity protein [Lactobacillus plantarum JDM1] [Lactiplantibacillus mudanjiangensis]
MTGKALAPVKQNIETLLASLKVRDQTTELLDIIDVLTQVDAKLDSAKNPEALINRLVNYVRSVALKGKLHFPTDEEKLLIDLSVFGQKAGLNGQYMADFSDKSQFYSLFEEVPRH